MKIATYLYLYFIILLSLGSIFIYSSSAFIASYFYSNSFYFYIKQCIAILVGIFLTYIISKIKLNILKKYFLYLYPIILFSNILNFIPGIKYPVNGAYRWINLFGFIFQPSELLKFGYLFYNAFIFYFYYDQIKYVLLFIFLNILIATLILTLQSDFGLIILFYGITFLLLWNYLYHKKILFYAIGLGIFILIALIYFTPYRITRIMTFLNPWEDPQGKGFQIIQSLIAIYNGNLWGKGIGLSRQKNLFLPMCHTDFIFSIIIEEIGIVVSLFFIALLLYFPYIMIKKTEFIENIWEKNYIISVGLLIIFQIIINISTSIALLPTKGIGLPFISYGMSSVMGFSILVGIVINIFKQR